MSKQNKWIITISQHRSVNDIAKELKDAGFMIRDILEEVGCIIGSADDSTIQELDKITGIVDIAPDIQIDLEPPDSGETW